MSKLISRPRNISAAPLARPLLLWRNIVMKVYIEYKVIPEKREQYLNLIDQAHQFYKKFPIHHFSIYEGVEQPNRFVEDIDLADSHTFSELKKKRLQDEGFWEEVHSCIEGNRSKLRVYAFRKIHSME
ncbi:hypothetical protein ACFSCZ_14145 [Siminovitchia sediminis]|uniref:Uncharacterized protein n=1 Tax=Siminovitchia sediminis TaxID=1274353 RepID=A0ABW4KNQ6_9BACI